MTEAFLSYFLRYYNEKLTQILFFIYFFSCVIEQFWSCQSCYTIFAPAIADSSFRFRWNRPFFFTQSTYQSFFLVIFTLECDKKCHVRREGKRKKDEVALHGSFSRKFCRILQLLSVILMVVYSWRQSDYCTAVTQEWLVSHLRFFNLP